MITHPEHEALPAATARRVYLDHAATSPMRPAVRMAMAPWWNGTYGNASSGHAEGRAAKRALGEAREAVASLVGARPEEVVFTSGATEASNLAVRGAAVIRRNGGKRVVTSAIEHAATRKAVEQLAVDGWEVRLLEVDGTGTVAVPEAIAHGTAVLSVIAGHNELGTIQPLAALAEAAHRVGALFHLDAVQAAGYLDLSGIDWDLLSLSAHKLGGPQGVGALVRRRKEPLAPLLLGGTGDGGLRPGTVPVALAVGFAVAAEAAQETRRAETRRLAGLREALTGALLEAIPGARRLGSPGSALPQILTLGIPGLAGDELVWALDQAGVAASSASACLSGAKSPTLAAIGAPEELAMLRLSTGWSTVEAEAIGAVEAIAGAIARLRAASPFERRSGLLAERAAEARVVLTPEHWEAALALHAFYMAEGVLPGARAIAKRLPHGPRLEALFPFGVSTLASWLGLPVPQGGCRPYAG